MATRGASLMLLLACAAGAFAFSPVTQQPALRVHARSAVRSTPDVAMLAPLETFTTLPHMDAAASALTSLPTTLLADSSPLDVRSLSNAGHDGSHARTQILHALSSCCV